MINNLGRSLALALFVAIAAMAGEAGAADLKLLSVEAMKPALQELAPGFESEFPSRSSRSNMPAPPISRKKSVRQKNTTW